MTSRVEIAIHPQRPTCDLDPGTGGLLTCNIHLLVDGTVTVAKAASLSVGTGEKP